MRAQLVGSSHLWPLPGDRHRIRQCTQVQPGASHEQRLPSAAGDVGDRRTCDAGEVGDGVGLRRLHEVVRVHPACRSDNVGFAVPMSMRRYTCMASTATISTLPRTAAYAIARSLLPEAVGPTMTSGDCSSDA